MMVGAVVGGRGPQQDWGGGRGCWARRVRATGTCGSQALLPLVAQPPQYEMRPLHYVAMLGRTESFESAAYSDEVRVCVCVGGGAA